MSEGNFELGGDIGNQLLEPQGGFEGPVRYSAAVPLATTGMYLVDAAREGL